MKPPKKTTSKSLLNKTSGTDLMTMTSRAVKSWAKSNNVATAKEIDGMSKGQLQSLYMKYLKAKGM
jgi:hypothetical protein